MTEVQSEINQLNSIIGMKKGHVYFFNPCISFFLLNLVGFIYVGLEQLFGGSVTNAEETTQVDPKRQGEGIYFVP